MKWLEASQAHASAPPIEGIVFDIDNTVYHCPGYYQAGTAGEIREVARLLGKPADEMKDLIAERKSQLTEQSGRKATMTETVHSFGITPQQWNELRCRVWNPEEWLKTDPPVCQLFSQLGRRYRVVFGTNSPAAIGWRILKVVGITDELPAVPVFGPEHFGVSKPAVMFFTRVAESLGLPPEQCLSIGDREEVDGRPAINAGFAGAIIVPDSRDELVVVGERFLQAGGCWREELQSYAR